MRITSIRNSVIHVTKNAHTRGFVIYRKVRIELGKRPLLVFFLTLGLLLLLIILGNLLRSPTQTSQKQVTSIKQVSVYNIGSVPKIRVQAQIEKSGVVTITSLTQGVVQKIHAIQGEHVRRGQTLISLSTNYQGGNALSTQRLITQKQYESTKDTFQLQKETIDKQKDQARKTEIQASELRAIQAQSISSTQSLISLNNTILSTLGQNLNQFQANNTGGINNQNILSTQILQSQFQSANNQLNQSLLTAQYQSSDTNTPAELARLQRDITIKQLELQQKTLDLNLEVSKLQLQVAQINEATMYPSAPFSSTVQRVFVKMGEAVNPGTPLVLLAQDVEDDPIVAIAYVPKDIADQVSLLEPSVLYFNGKSYQTYPSYISQEAISGELYGIYYPIPDGFSADLTDKGSIQVDLPVGRLNTSAIVPFVPIDAVFQTQDGAFIYIVTKGQVVSKKVTLGAVLGNQVEILSGLSDKDQVILNRNVIAGDKVQVN